MISDIPPFSLISAMMHATMMEIMEISNNPVIPSPMTPKDSRKEKEPL